MSTTAKQQRASRFLASLAPDQVSSTVNGYSEIYDAGVKGRKEHYRSFVNSYYDLVTDFYRFGWGDSFHFAPRNSGESFKASLLRHQTYLSDRLSLKPGMQVLDVGCGIGGPMGTLARHSGANFIGINNNAYQIKCAKRITRDVQSQCDFIQGDYMQIPAGDNSYDAAFAIEATPHAPDKTALFREIMRILRPGGCFASYEWCMTGAFDPDNDEHQRIKNDIMEGDALPDIGGMPQVDAALEAAGFELLYAQDRASGSDPSTPWYRALQGRDLSLSGLPRTPFGRVLANVVLRAGERLRLIPEGAHAVSSLLNSAADALEEGGRYGIFTPMYFILARKPLR